LINGNGAGTYPRNPAQIMMILLLILILLPPPVFVQAGNSVNGLQQGVGQETDSALPGDFEDTAAYNNDETYTGDDESDIEEHLLPSLDEPPILISASSPAGAAKTNNGLQQEFRASTLTERSLSLDETLSNLGAVPDFRWDPLFKTGNISLFGHYAAFSAGHPGEQLPVILDSREILTLPAPWLENGLLRFPESFVTALKQAFNDALINDQFRYRIAAIVVDPGHGGKDPGAQGTHTINGKTLKLSEKDITLKSSLYLYSRLIAAYPDKRVLLTRDRDTYPTLEERVLLANSVPLKDNEAILYVSIHANASLNRHARGYEVWYLSPDYRRNLIDKEKFSDSAEILPIMNDMLQEEFTYESIMIAQAINRRIGETMGPSLPARGLKAEEWFVVRNARMPSVLVELGFVTNPADAEILNSTESLKKLTEAIYKGIIDFVTSFESSGGFIFNQ
jgi:N-acetylmuramoyl-L-alanine amidase